MEEIHNTELSVPCPIGTLEARIMYGDCQNSCGVILCPPHPLLAGNMDNNVIQTLAKTICHSFPVLLFNYRTVGKSSNPEPDLPLFEFWDRLDKSQDFSAIIEDTKLLLAWSKKLFSTHHLIGYSFGAFIAQQVADTEKTCSLTAITPPLDDHDFTPLLQTAIPTTIFFAQEDDLTATDTQSLEISHPVITMANTDHFFRTREQELADQVLQNFQ